MALAPQPEERSIERTDMRQRRNAAIVLGVMITLLFGVLFSQAAFNLKFLQPDSNQQTFVFAGLSAIIFLLFVALAFVLIRNLLKLYAETRSGVLGSRFRTKMVIGALLLSLTPTVFLFLFAYSLMNRSIDKWFSRPVEELREDSQALASLLQRYVVANAAAEAEGIAEAAETQRAYASSNFGPVVTEMRRHEATLQGGFVIALRDGEPVASFHVPEPWGELRRRLRTHPPAGAGAQNHPLQSSPMQTIETADGRQFLFAQAAVGPRGAVLVAMPIPAMFFEQLARIEKSQKRYYDLGRSRKQVRQFYMMLLSVITAAVLFASTWLSLFISRLVARPVAALAEATQEISRGNLDYRVAYRGSDELGLLVERFNHMADELESGRREILESRADLEQANRALEQRRRQIETILESIPTGVISVSPQGQVTRVNRAFTGMFPSSRNLAAEDLLGDIFEPEIVREITRLMRKADRMGSAGAQLEIQRRGAHMEVVVTAAALDVGHVLVFEDFSDLLRAQKQAAWREVARRVAHEIKNPLTPIALSAERIKRQLDRGLSEEKVRAVITSSTETIASNVEVVRGLVNDFASMAQFPAPRPVATDVNAIVQSALLMFDGRLSGIDVRTELAEAPVNALADPQGIQRAIANLVDNAAEAMSDSLLKQIVISTATLDDRDAVEIAIADTGSGVTSAIKERLFLPYFSTKDRGTGLGLAIVSRIVQEHGGSIRVEENSPLGSRFVIELPAAPAAGLNANAAEG